jgi:hypothetical protein
MARAAGSCSGVSLVRARKAAAAVMGDVAKGRNPSAERKRAAVAERARRARSRLTLRVLIEDLLVEGRLPRLSGSFGPRRTEGCFVA